MTTETKASPFNWKYALGMTSGRTRHTVYKDWDKKVQKEVHGDDVSFWADGVKEPFADEQELIDRYNGKK